MKGTYTEFQAESEGKPSMHMQHLENSKVQKYWIKLFTLNK